MPGDTVKVTAVVENAGLTTARGCDVHIYETRNGVRGRELTSLVSSDKIVVNTARKINFTWTMPGNLEGIGLECVVRERNPQTGGFFDPVTTAHSPFELAAELSQRRKPACGSGHGGQAISGMPLRQPQGHLRRG